MTDETHKPQPDSLQAMYDIGKDLLSREAIEDRVNPRAARAMRIQYLKCRNSAGVTPPIAYHAALFNEKPRVITEEEYRFRVIPTICGVFSKTEKVELAPPIGSPSPTLFFS